MNTPWHSCSDGENHLDRRLRNLDVRLAELFTPDLHDPDKIATFRNTVIRHLENERERTRRDASFRGILAASGLNSRTRVKCPLVRASAAIVALSVVLVGAFLIAARLAPPAPMAGIATASVEKPDLKFSIMTTTDLGPFWLAVKSGYFRDAGFTFDPATDVTVAKSGTESVGKLATNQVDIAYSTYTPFFMAQSKGQADLKLVADASSAGPNSCMVVTGPNSRVKSIKDMAGARVAVTARNTISDLLTMSALKSNGIDYKSIRWVETPFPTMAEKLASGEIDAAFLTEPFLSHAEKTVGAIPLFDTATGPRVNIPTAGFGASAEFVRKYPKTVAAFQKVMERATTEAKADRAKVEPLLQQTTNIDAETAKSATLLTFQSSLDAGRIQRVADLMLEFGMLKEKIDVSQMIAKSPDSR